MSFTDTGNEDNLLLTSTSLQTLVPLFTSSGVYGLSPFVVLAVLASLLKAFPSLQASPKSVEDWLLVLATVLGSLGGILSSHPEYAIYGLTVGWFLKAVVGLQHGFNVEDMLLAVFALLSMSGIALGNGNLSSLALLFGQFGKSLAGGGSTLSAAPSA